MFEPRPEIKTPNASTTVSTFYVGLLKKSTSFLLDPLSCSYTPSIFRTPNPPIPPLIKEGEGFIGRTLLKKLIYLMISGIG
jgi:hypothetical protein